jgi:hypothetical protein
VQVRVTAIERDNGKVGDEDMVDDIPSTRVHPATRFGSAGGSITFRHDWGMKALDKDHRNEIQHCVQLRARVNDGTTPGPWTGWTDCEYSPVRSLISARLLVPAYIYPARTASPGKPTWQEFCKAHFDRGHSAVLIMNPNSGPGTTADANYRQAVSDCQQTYGHTVIGYVATSNGSKSLADVKREVDLYRQLYPDLRGIFLDEMSTNDALKSHYRNIFTYIKASNPRALVVGNPGTAASTSWQIATPRVADVVVVFEDTAAKYLQRNPPAWTTNRALLPRIAHLVHTTPHESIAQVCAAWRKHPSSYLYVTPDVMLNPWDTWSLNAAAESCLT